MPREIPTLENGFEVKLRSGDFEINSCIARFQAQNPTLDCVMILNMQYTHD